MNFAYSMVVSSFMVLQRSAIILLLLLAGSALHCRAAVTHRLQNLAKVDDFDQTRIVFDFSELPEFHLETSGQRVDLLLRSTDIASSLNVLPEDDKVVKVLLARKTDELLVSILLHQIPARVASIKSPATKQLTLDIRWAADAAKRPAIAFQLNGMPTPHKTLKSVATPQQSSAYAGRWKDFFRTFHTPPELHIALRHTIPASPAWSLEKAAPPLKSCLGKPIAANGEASSTSLKRQPAPICPRPNRS